MNRQYTKWVLRAMLPLTLAACRQEAVETETLVSQDLYTIQASVDNGAQGRAQIELNRSEVENERFYWNSGDEFTLFDLTDAENPVTSVFRINDSYNDASWGNPSSSASFSTSVPMTLGHSVTAVYPPVPQEEDGKVALSLSQDCPNGNDDGWKDYMRRNMMMAAQTKVETNVRMNFQHLCAMFRISFINNTNSWLEVKKVIVKTDGNYMSNRLSLDLSSLGVQPEVADAVSLTCAGSWGVNSRSSKNFYLLFFPGENFSESATLTVEMEMSNGMKLESAPRELKDLNAEGFKAGLRYWLSLIYTADQLVWKATVGEGMLTTPELVRVAVNAGATTDELGFVDMTDEANQAAVQQVTSIRIRQADLSELKYFPNLEELDCNNSQLTSLDLSELTNLKRLYCNNNKLTSLDLTNVSNLEVLECNRNELTSLDLSELKYLKRLDCNSNKLTSISFATESPLEVLYCHYNQLADLDLSAIPNLVVLNCSDNVQLSNLDFAKYLPKLQDLGFRNTRTTSLDRVPKNLVALSCGFNPYTSFDLTPFTQLKVLNLDNIDRKDLDFSGNLLLEDLSLWNNYPMEELNISMLGQLKTLNLGACPSLKGKLDFSGNPLLKELDFHWCGMVEEVDLSGNEVLERLYCYNCALTELDITCNPSLSNVRVGQQKQDGASITLTLKLLPEQNVQWENNWKNYSENAGVNVVVQDLGTTEGGSGGFDNWGNGGIF